MKKENIIKNNFFVVISLLTFVIMLTGATFAYFSTTVRVGQALNVSSVDIRLKLGITPKYNGTALIPTNDEDIDFAYQNECKDSLGNDACTAYTIKVTNDGDKQDIIGTFKIDNEKFKYLKFIVIDPDDTNNSRYQDITSLDTEAKIIGEPFSLESGQSKEFIILIWISNIEDNQDIQGLKFNGIVTFDTSAGVKLTGTMSKNS